MVRLEREIRKHREEVIFHWTARINGHVQRGELDRAADVLREAIAELPAEAAIQEAGALLHEAENRREAAWKLLVDGEAMLRQGEHANGIARAASRRPNLTRQIVLSSSPLKRIF